MKSNLYPLKFQPILKDKIWGGTKLNSLLNKDSKLPNVGESWEISDVEGDTSLVINGHLKGQSLKDLLKSYGAEMVGLQNHRIFEDKFPLLIKFIDAKEDLSIQLHPNDELARKRHNSFGKTEMWYVMQADENSNLIVGFNQKVTPELYLEHLEDKTLPKILNFDKVKSGDVYFIDVGRIHAIGAGVMLAEIQQTSDVTYRVYDWGRKDADGNERELHNDLALEAIGFDMGADFKVEYQKERNHSNKMVSCPYFTTNYLKIDATIQKNNGHGSFTIYICVEGEAEILTSNHTETIKKGETILIPAAIESFHISAKNATLLEVYV